MLTARGRWFLIAISGGLVVGALTPPEGHAPLVFTCLTLFLWFLAEWAWFLFRAQSAERYLTLVRELHDDRGPVKQLWAGRSFHVRVTVRLRGSRILHYLVLHDLLPRAAEHRDGATGAEVVLAPGDRVELEYTVFCPAAGRMRFEGVALRLTDLQGFFFRKAFLRAPIEFRVLPALADAEGRTQTSKRRNLLPPPGMHRHRQPGSGSELLELRDYLPGDPPKMIAWKVSARRDRLITKQFESEVPVRCTLFVDASNSVRLGPPGANALARLVEIAAAVAQAANSNRDPVGLGLFDEDGVRYLRPLWGHRHLTEVMRRLADVAGLAPVSGVADVDELLRATHAFAGEIYPDLLRPAINAFPAWLAWLKPPPFWTKQNPRLGDVFYGLMPWFVYSTLIPISVLGLWTALEALFYRVTGQPTRFILYLILAWLGTLPSLAVYSIILAQTSRQRRAGYRLRKELAALFSVHFGLPPDGLGLLLEDDREFTLAAQRFLAEHQVPAPLRLYDARGRYLFAAPAKVEVLAGTLLRAIGKGRDNEMFVLMADLLELTDRLGPLLRAVKVALARHHRVIVVCPWPPDLPVPPVDYKPDNLPPAIAHGPVRRAAEQVVIARFHDAFHELRQTFARLGVPVVCARDGDPARMVVERLDRLRALRASSSR